MSLIDYLEEGLSAELRWRFTDFSDYSRLTIENHLPIVFDGKNQWSYGWVKAKHKDGHIHEPATVSLISKIIEYQKGATFFDIGGLFGYFSLVAASNLNGTVATCCFEMNPNSYNALSANFANNRHLSTERIYKFNAGVSDYTEKGKSIFYKAFELLDDVKGANLKNYNKGVIDMYSIDDFCEENKIAPSVMKIDVEGFEGKVIAGAKKTFSRHRPAIVMELHSDAMLAKLDSSREDVIKEMLSLNYRCYIIPEFRSEATKPANIRFQKVDGSNLKRIVDQSINSLFLFA